MDFQYVVELVDEHGAVFARCTLRMLQERSGRLVIEEGDRSLPDGEYLMRLAGREIDVSVETIARLGPDVRVAHLHEDFDARRRRGGAG